MPSTTTHQDCRHCFSWWPDVGWRLAEFLGVWVKNDRFTYGWITFLIVSQLAVLAVVAVALSTPTGGGVVEARSEADAALLRLFVVFSALSLVVPPFTLYNNMGVASQSIITSVAENPRYKHILSGWLCGVLMVAVAFNIVPVVNLSKLSDWFVVVAAVSMFPSTCSIAAVAAACFSCIHATVRIIQRRTEWCEQLLADALEEGTCTCTLSLKIVRTHGASLSLIRRVSEGTSVTLSILVAGTLFSVALSFGHLIAFVGTDESLANAQATNLATNVVILVGLLSLPAWLSYTGQHAKDRLLSLCTASIEMRHQPLSVATSSVGMPARRLSAHTLRSRSHSHSESVSVGARSMSSESSSSSSRRSPSAVDVHVTFEDSLGPEIHFPTTLYEIPPMALRPPLGDRAHEEATALAHMAAHLSAEAPAYSMSGVRITVGLIAKIASSFVSIAIVILRLSNVSL